MNPAHEMRRSPRHVATCVGIGLLAGLLSGLFGVGGGTVVVPLLVLLLGLDQRLAAGTSLAAIVPTAAMGVIAYGLNDAVAWIPALLISAGAIGGAQVGTWLLPKMSQTVLRWIFVGFLTIIIVSLFMVIPSRDAQLELTWWNAAALVALGVLTGAVSGLIGVGGGIIVVPTLVLLFGTNTLEAKGTSLLMMIPAAISGTVGNVRRENVALVYAAWVGLAACTTTAMGTWLATIIEPLAGNVLFAVFLLCIAGQMAAEAIRGRHSR